MTNQANTQEAVQGTMAGLTGLGVLGIALFPLSLPFLFLTAAALAPLLLVGAVAAVPIALIATVAMLARAIGKRSRRGAVARGGEFPTARTGAHGIAKGAQHQ